MSAFAFEALDGQGRRRTGRIEAASREAAAAAIRAGGLRIVSLAEAPGALPFWQRDLTGSGGPARRDVLAFLRDLATLLGADLTVDRALRMALRQAPPRLRPVAEALLSAVVAGVPLSEAMRRQPAAFEPETVEVVRAGEMTGTLPGVLSDIVHSMARREEIRSAVTSALVYPALLAVMAVGIVILVLTSLVPSIAPLFDVPGASPPAVIALVGGARRLLAEHGLPMAGLGALALGGGAALWRAPGMRERRARTFARLPLVGPILVDLDAGRLCRVLGTLVKAQVPIPDAVAAARNVPRSPLFRETLGAARGRIAAGARLGEALAPLGSAAPRMLAMLRTGEEVNRLGEMLIHAADLADAEAKTRIDRLFTLMTPAITGLLGLVIGGLILSIMSAVLSVNDLAGLR